MFSEIDTALLEQIDTQASEDYWFIALAEAKAEVYSTHDGTEYDVNVIIQEVKDLSDLPGEWLHELRDSSLQTG